MKQVSTNKLGSFDNSKIKCINCKEYFDKEDCVLGLPSYECLGTRISQSQPGKFFCKDCYNAYGDYIIPMEELKYYK